jgi:hypothetical protein
MDEVNRTLIPLKIEQVETRNQALLMGDKEFLSIEIMDDKSIDQIVEVSGSFLEKKNMFNDFESMVTNKLFSEWLPMVGTSQP